MVCGCSFSSTQCFVSPRFVHSHKSSHCPAFVHSHCILRRKSPSKAFFRPFQTHLLHHIQFNVHLEDLLTAPHHPHASTATMPLLKLTNTNATTKGVAKRLPPKSTNTSTTTKGVASRLPPKKNGRSHKQKIDSDDDAHVQTPRRESSSSILNKATSSFKRKHAGRRFGE